MPLRQKPNEKCACGSGLKFKRCCAKQIVNVDHTIGHAYTPEIAHIIRDMQLEYSNHTIIDITHLLDANNYRNYQLTNYTSKIIMIALRNPDNESAFISRSISPADNVMILYRGAYRVFNIANWLQICSDIYGMINGRLADGHAM